MSRYAERIPAPATQRKEVPPAPVRPGVQRPALQKRAAIAQAIQLRAAKEPSTEPAGPKARGGLPAALRVGVERLSGLAMDDVRVHRNSAEPAKLGALAYTRGSDIHLGPGQERHLPHEAWHVVQQKQGRVTAGELQGKTLVNSDAALEAEADAVGSRLRLSHLAAPDLQPQSSPRALAGLVQLQADDARAPAPKQNDPELALGTLLMGVDYSAGFTLAFFQDTDPKKEPERRAADFAKRENSLGFTGSAPSAATIRVARAIPAGLGVAEMTVAVADIAERAVARIPDADAIRSRVKSLALFVHGWPTGTQIGLNVDNEDKLIKTISSKLASGVQITLFACNAGRSYEETESWGQGTLAEGGAESLASEIRNAMIDNAVEGRVWAHAVGGHVSYNTTKRYFETSAGKGAAGKSYLREYVFTNDVIASVTRDISDGLQSQGYAVSVDDPQFRKQVTNLLIGKDIYSYFYDAYMSAFRTLGKALAQEIPDHPEAVAGDILSHWTDTYWPKRRQEAVDSIVKAMKLKKSSSTGTK